MAIDTSNRHIVSFRPSDKRVLIIRAHEELTPDEALNLAAWLVAIADGKAKHTFDEIREAIEGG
jgi:hypothetical protein